jgi:MoaA/NifB/PqqE/SkfB family radical SAM enzyme
MFIDSGLQILHVGIDGMTQESYEKYRGSGNLSLVLKNLKKVLELRGSRKTPFIRASMLASCYNENEVDQFNELMESMNMDEWSIDKMQVNPNESIEWLPDNEELRYQNYTSIGAEFTKKPCVRLWSEMVINWDGNISACCIVDDKNADFANDINKGSVDLETIWNNSSYLSARSSFTAEPKTGKHTICHECKNMVGSKELSYVGKTFSLKLESTKLE